MTKEYLEKMVDEFMEYLFSNPPKDVKITKTPLYCRASDSDNVEFIVYNCN